nr:hypothetical protein 5 [bacterium]
MWKNWKGRQLLEKFDTVVSNALVDAGNEVGQVSDQQVPHDEGYLQESKFIGKNPTNIMDVRIGYGGGGNTGFPVVPYALKWHEVPANFQKGRKHNYLKDPVDQVGPGALMKNLKKAMAKL